MKIAKQYNLGRIDLKSDKDILNYLKTIDTDLSNIFLCLQGRVRFGTGEDGANGENISGEFQTVADSGTADTEFSVAHTLGAVPIGYIVTKIDAGGVVYDSGTTWTSTTIYLKCSSADTAITLFLLK